MAYNYLTQHTPQTVGGGGGGDAVYGKPKWTKIGSSAAHASLAPPLPIPYGILE